MVCIVDENNIIVNITTTEVPIEENEREYFPWNNLWELYSEKPPVEYIKQEKLQEVDAWTAKKIIGGFTSSATGSSVKYDSDKDTQLTMQGIALNVNTELFAEKYPTGCPVRGYEVESTDEEGNITWTENKTVLMLSAEQVLRWCADLSIHIGTCKQQGWMKQAEVNACTTTEEVEAIVLD